MSIRARLLLFSTFWLVGVFIFYNVFVFSTFFRETIKKETELMWNRAQLILRQEHIRHPENWNDPKLLEEYLAANSMVRIITPESNIALQVSNNNKLTANPPVYRTSYHTKVLTDEGDRIMYIQVPIKLQDQQVGLLEIGKSLNVLNDYLGVLLTALTLTTISTILFATVGGYFYTRMIIRPLNHLVNAMQKIEESGNFIRLENNSKNRNDELARLSTTFNRMIQRLENNDTKQRQFMEDVSHELRTPLTVIQSYASMLQRWAGEDPHMRKEAIDAIQTESTRLKEMVERMPAPAKDRHQYRLQLAYIDMVDLIRSISGHLIKTHQRDMNVHVKEENIWAVVDPEKIKQLLVILYDNALKYSHSSIDTYVELKEKKLCIHIKDRGIGIPEEHIPNIFERFYRVNRDRNRKTGGFGLGLAIAKDIVQAHRGTIQVKSKKGKGTTFIVTLPVYHGAEKNEQAGIH